jgi:hypothetical protein
MRYKKSRNESRNELRNEYRNDSRSENTQDENEFREKLWREYAANYRQLLVAEPEKFSDYTAQVRELWLSAR